jgi:hypothetical protein
VSINLSPLFCFKFEGIKGLPPQERLNSLASSNRPNHKFIRLQIPAMEAKKFTTAQARKLAGSYDKLMSMTFHELDPIIPLEDFGLEEGQKLIWSLQSILIQRDEVEYTVDYHVDQWGDPPTMDEQEFLALLKRSVEYHEGQEGEDNEE